MGELFSRALAGDVSALGGVVSLLTIITVLPAATIFVINQALENAKLREDKYRYLHDQYVDYLKLCLAYPKFGFEHGSAVSYRTLEQEDRQTISIIFEIFTALLEAAFKVFQGSVTSARRTQWQGWVRYLDRYLDRQDYFEYVTDWMFGGNVHVSKDGLLDVSDRGLSEYDADFDQFLLERLRLAWLRRTASQAGSNLRHSA